MLNPLLEGLEIGLGIIIATAGKPGADRRYGCGLAGRVLLQNIVGTAKGFTAFGRVSQVASNRKLGTAIGRL